MITGSTELSKGYSPHANTVENDRELSSRDRSVYDRILHKADRKTGRARFNYKKITELEKCSARTLARAFAKLEQRNHIWRKFTGRGYIFYIAAVSGPKPEAVESPQTRRTDEAKRGRSALTPVAGQSGQRRLGPELRTAMGVHSALTPVSTLLDKNSSNKKDESLYKRNSKTQASLAIDRAREKEGVPALALSHSGRDGIRTKVQNASGNDRAFSEIMDSATKHFGGKRVPKQREGWKSPEAPINLGSNSNPLALNSEHAGKQNSLRESIPENHSDKVPSVQNPSPQIASAFAKSSPGLFSEKKTCEFCTNHKKLDEVLDANKGKCFGIYGELGLRALCHFLAEELSLLTIGYSPEEYHAQAENFLSQVQTRLSLDEWYGMTLPELNRARDKWSESAPDPTSDLSELDRYVSMNVHGEPDLDLNDSISSTKMQPELVGSK